MRSQLAELLEKGELALGSCHGVIEVEHLEAVGRTLANVRTRLAYPEEVLVVALAGGTGSGKSSIFNALAGDDLVDVGGVRPTTSSPSALVPVGVPMDGYLDLMTVEARHEGAGHSWLCLLDLPDYDSVETAHRLVFDELLTVVDFVVWVADPEKYRDARLYREYLTPLAVYQEQFLYVLNQVDRLSSTQLEEVIADYALALGEAGISNAEVIPVSVAPHLPSSFGVDELVDAISERRDVPVYRKLFTDLAETSRVLVEAVGTPIEFDLRAVEVVDSAVGELAAERVGAAADVLIRFIGALAAECGGETGAKLDRLAADVFRHMARIARRGDDEPGEQIRRAVVRPVRAVLAKRALAIASVSEFALAVDDVARP